MGAIQDLLRPIEGQFLVINERLFVMEAFLAELERVTRGKAFRIWNGVLWMMVLDSRDAHVTHFASWLKSLYARGGFFGHLQAQHLKAFSRQWCRDQNEAADPDRDKMLEDYHRECFERLFPECTTPSPKPHDIECLRQRFAGTVAPVVCDRDCNRAHPFENLRTATGTAKMLAPAELRSIAEYVQQCLNDLRLVSTSLTLHYHDTNIVPSDVAAADLVDAILIGPSSRAALVMAGRDRLVYYTQIHARHDALTSDNGTLFNDAYDEDNDAYFT